MSQRYLIMRAWVLGSACAGLITSLVLQPATAAYFERMPASMCRPATPWNFSHHYLITATATMLELFSSTPKDFICKIPDKSNLPASSITSIKVALRDNHSSANITVKACAFDAATGTGGDCGTPKTTSGTGYNEWELNTSGELAKLQAGKTPYLWINLPGAQSGAYSAIAGLYFYSSTM